MEEVRMITRSFVRFTPDVEVPDPEFDQNLKKVLELIRTQMKDSAAGEGSGRGLRMAHAKGYGLARGEVDSPQDVLRAGGVTCTRPVTSSGK